jgi:hypothetical protein
VGLPPVAGSLRSAEKKADRNERLDFEGVRPDLPPYAASSGCDA